MQTTRTGENHLLCSEIKKDAFALFRQLKQKCATSSASLKALNGKLLSDRASVAARWQQHFSTLLNWPTQSPPDALVSGAQVSTPDSTIDTFHHSIIEVYKAMNKIKTVNAPAVCGIYREYIQHGGSDALRTLHKIVTRIWEEEVVPEEWHQGIIIPFVRFLDIAGIFLYTICDLDTIWNRC